MFSVLGFHVANNFPSTLLEDWMQKKFQVAGLVDFFVSSFIPPWHSQDSSLQGFSHAQRVRLIVGLVRSTIRSLPVLKF